MFRHRRVTNKCVLQHILLFLETILWSVSEWRSLEEGGGKLWRPCLEQNEQRGENYCGIETGIRTVGREILSAGVLELWTGVLMFPCEVVLTQIPRHCWNTEFCEQCDPATELFLSAFAKFAKSVMFVRLSVPPHGSSRFSLDGFSWSLIFGDFSKIYL